MKKETGKKSKLWIWLIALLVVLLAAGGVAYMMLSGGEQIGVTNDPTTEATTEPLSDPSLRADLYWNIDRVEFTENSETGLSTRTPAEDGQYHIRFAYNGEVLDLIAADKKIVNIIDTQDVMGLEFDEQGQIIKTIQPLTIAMEVGKRVYVQYVEGDTIITNSSLAMNGMEMPIKVTDLTGIYEVNPTSENLGKQLQPSDLKPFDCVTIYANMSGDNTHVYVLSHAESSKMYFRCEQWYNSSEQKTTRTPDENGVYSIDFFCDGERITLQTKDPELLRKIDSLGHHDAYTGLTFDENGYFDSVMEVSVGLGGLRNVQRMEVDSVDGRTVYLKNVYNSNGPSEQTVTIPEGTPIYDMSVVAEVEGRQGQEIEMVQPGDRITMWSDMQGNPIMTIVTLRRVDMKPYYSPSRKYNSTTHETTRVRNADGYFTISLVAEGEGQKDYLIKDEKVAQLIDRYAERTVGIVTEGNVIVRAYDYESIFGYNRFCTALWVDSINGSIISASTGNGANVYNTIMSPDCKIIDVTDTTVPGSKTELRVGDRIIAFRDTNKEVCMIWTAGRTLGGSDLYVNVSRQYDSTKKETTRTPDEDGYYVFDMTNRGKQVTIKTKSKDLATKIDSFGVRVMGMYVNNGIAQQAFNGGQVTGGWIDLYNGVVTDVIDSTTIEFHNEGKPETTYTYPMVSGYQCYNISAAVDSYIGEKTTPKVGDWIMVYCDRTETGVAMFVLKRPLHNGLYWNEEPMYNGTTKTTARTPDADGYYVYNMSYQGKQVTLKTKDIKVATSVDSYSSGMALNLKGDIILSAASYANTKDATTVKYGGWDVASISGNTVNLKFNRFSDIADDTASFNMSSAKVYDMSPTAEVFGQATKLQVGDRVRVHANAEGTVTYIYVTVRNATKTAYCEHCDKEVFWNPWTGGNFDANSGHYYVVTDTTIYTQYTCSSGKEMEAVLDLNGKTITRNGGGRMFLVSGADTLTIMDSVGGGTIQGMGGLGSLGNIALVTNDSTLNLLNGTLKNIGTEEMASARGGVIYVYGEGSSFNMFGGEIIGGMCLTDEKYTTSYGSMYIYYGTFNMSGGIIRDGKATLGGNVYLADKGKFNMTGGTITGGEAYTNGGNIYASSNAVVNISGGEITGGLSHNVAGNLFVSTNGVATISGGTITGGVAQPQENPETGELKATYGGNIYLNDATLNVNGGVISNGDATRGGNINIGGNASVLNIAGGTVTGGKADQGGNVRVASTATINVTSGGITDGTSTNTGGNIFMGFGAKLNVTGGEISGGGKPAEGATTTCKYGGNVYVYGGDCEINISNGASVSGGYSKGNGANICIATVSGVAAKLNVNSGVLDGGVQVSKETVVTVSGAAKIGNRQNGVNLLSGSMLVLGNLTQGAEVCVNADGAFTVANAKAAEYLAAGYIKGVNSALIITEKDGVLYANKPAEEIFNGVYAKAVEMTEKGVFAKGGIVEVECPYCGVVTEWEPLPELTANEKLTLGNGHYYLSDKANYDSSAKAEAYYEIDLNATACLHLNGQNITSGNRAILVRVGAKLTTMGDGVVKGAGAGVHKNFNGGAMDMLGATVNLCGGTYMTTGATPIFSTRSDYKTTLGIFEGTTIQGAETNTISSLYLYGKATVNMYGGTIAGGTATGNYGGNVNMFDVYETVFNLYGGTITGGTSNQGGNIRVAEGVVNVYGGTIEKGNSTNTGGNVFLLVGATLNVEGGSIVNGNATNNGGNVYIYGDNTVAISGGEIAGGTSANNGGKNIYFQAGEKKEGGKLIMTGGSVESSVFVNSACTVELSGAPTIGAANGGLYIAEGLKITLGDLTAGTEICVTATGEFTNAHAKAAEYLAAGYFKGAIATIIITEKDGVLIAGKISENVAYKDVYEKAQKMTEDGIFESNESVVAVCPFCGATVKWEPLPALTAEKLVINQNAHYYLASNVNYDSSAYAESFYEIDGKAAVCLHLNGQTITSGNRAIFARVGTKVNVMGDGTIQGAGAGEHKNFNGGAFDMLGATVNLCGGTYKVTGAAPIISTRSEYLSTLNIYDGTIQGAETNTVSSIYLYGKATVNMNGGTIAGGTSAGNYGGNVFIADKYDVTFNMYDGVITGGTSGQGGNIRATKGTVNVYGGTISAGTATTNGGNIFLFGGATLNMEGGSIEGGAAPNGSGGNIYIYGAATVKLSGDANITGATAKNGGGKNIYFLAAGEETSKLIMNGGSVANSVFASKATTIELSGAPTIGAANGALYMTEGAKLVLGELTEGTEIYITATGAISEPCAKAAEYLAAGYFKGATDKYVITENDGVLVVTVVSEEEIYGSVYEEALKMTENGTFDSNGTVEARCPVCYKTVTWQPLPALTAEKLVINENAHYYLASNVSYDSSAYAESFYEIDGKATFCLHLNEQTLTSGNRAFFGRIGTTLNMMGEGTIQGAGAGVHKNFNGGAFDMLGTTVNLFGGTYKTVGATPIISTRSEYLSTLNIYEGTIQGAETNTISSLYLYGKATVNMYGGTIAGGTSTGNYGGNVYMADKYATIFNLYDGIVTGGTSGQGGNIRVAKGTVNIYGGTMSAGNATTNGGNIFLFGGATLNMEGGSIENGTAPNGSGGNVYVYGAATVKLSGEATITGATTKNGGGKNVYFQKVGEEASKLVMNGGAIANSVFACANTSIELSGAPTIGAANGGLYMVEGALISMGELTEGTEIFITAEGIITEPHVRAAEYLAAGYFKGATSKHTITEDTGILVVTVVSQDDIFENAYEAAKQMTEDEVFASNGTVEAVCPVCYKTVTWQPLPALTEEKLVISESAHYYLASNVSYDSQAYDEAFYEIDGKATVCLHLNGQTMNSGNRTFFGRVGTTMNVMGDGTIQGAGYGEHKNFNGGAFDMLGATVNLFGGTYMTTGEAPIISTRSEYLSTLNIYEGTIQGAETNTISSLYLYGKATVNMYGGTIAGGTSTGNYGGNVYMADKYDTIFNLYDGIVTGGTSGQGGNIRVAKGTVNIYGGTMSAGNATTNGGNIFLFGGATLNMEGGSIENGTAPNGSGGNVYIYGAATVNMSGDANITGATAKNGGGKNIYFQSVGEETSKLVMNGASIESSVFVSKATTVELSGAPTIGAANGGLYIAEGALITLGELTEGTEINVTVAATGAISQANAKAAEYLAAGYFKSTGKKIVLSVVEDALYATLMSDADMRNEVAEKADEMADAFTSNAATVEAVCPYCDKTVTWQVLPALTEEKLVISESAHYYLASNISYDSEINDEAYYELDNKATICLHLNGQTMNSGNRAFAIRQNCVLNVMGSGTVQGVGGGQARNYNGGAFDLLGGQLNLCGGTYMTTGAAPIISTRGVTGVPCAIINIYNGTTIQGAETNTVSNLYLYGEAEVNMYGGTIAGGTSTAVNGGNVHMADAFTVTFNMYDGIVTGGTATQGGNFYAGKTGTINLVGGSVENGTATTQGGNFRLSGTTVNMTAATVSGGEAVGNNGGNFFLLGGAKLNMTGGKIENGKAMSTASGSGNGGNIYTYGNATVNLSGDATISGGQSRNNGGKNLYAVNYDGAALKLVMNGGAIDSSVFMSSLATVELSGAPTIGAANGGLYITEGAKITLGELTEGTEIYLSSSATCAISEANEKAADYLAAGYFKTTGKKYELSVAENALYMTVMSDADLRNTVAQKADEMAPDFASNAATVETTCPYCDKTVTWEPLPALGTEKMVLTENKHYYLASNVSYDSTANADAFYELDNKAAICLYLNGQTMNSGNRCFAVRQECVLNVMGSGTLQGVGVATSAPNYNGGAFDLLGGQLTLCGGTYMTTGETPIISTRGSAGVPCATVNIYEGTTIQGAESNTVANLYLYGEAVVNMYGGAIQGGVATGNVAGNVHISDKFDVTFNLYDGTISGGSSKQGGNFRIAKGTLNIYGGTITGGVSPNGNGGNIFLLNNATVNAEAGIIENGAAPAGSGGNIYAYGANTVKLSGSASITGGTSKNGGGKNIYLINAEGAGGKLVMNGGSVQSSIYAGTLATIELSGAPTIGSANGGLYLDNGAKITMGELTEGTKIMMTVVANGAIAEANEKAAEYLAAGYFEAISSKTILSVEENVLTAKQISELEFRNGISAKADAMTDTFAAGGAVEAECPLCDRKVTWEALPTATADIVVLESKHYYLASGVDYTANSFRYNAENVNICLHLNGQTVGNTAGRTFWVTKDTVLNVMGSGTITGVGEGTATTTTNTFRGAAFDINDGATVNLLGGTYTTAGTVPAFTTRDDVVSTINVYEGTTIQGAATNAASNVLLGGAGNLNLYAGSITGGTGTTEAAPWFAGNVQVTSGKAVLNVYGGEITGGTAGQGGNIRISGGVVNVYGGKISAGTATVNGGNVFMSGGTLNVEGGIIENGSAVNAAKTTNGGNIYTYGAATVKLSGDAVVTGGTCSNSVGKNIYMLGVSGVGATLIVDGATIENSVYAAAGCTIKLSGAAKIGSGNMDLYMADGVQLTLGEMAEGAEIYVRPVNQVNAFTTETEKANEYATYFKTNIKARSVIAKDNALYITTASEEAVLMTQNNVFASGEKVTAVCPVCAESVEWTPLTGAATLSTANYATGNHFYLASDVALTSSGSIKTDTTIANVCLHLNGKSYKQAATVTNAIGALWAVADTELNIMGEGTVTGAGYKVSDTRFLGGAIDARGTVNIYGGTYMSTSTEGRPAVTTMTKGIVNMYAGTITRDASLTVSNTSSSNVMLDTASDTTEFNMFGGTISNGSAVKGGNVYMTRGVFTMTGGTIENGVCTGSDAGSGHGAGNVYIAGGTFTQKGGTITGGTAASIHGGNIRVDKGTFVMEDGIISNGSAANLGGNFRIGGGSVTIKGGQVLGGTVTSSGGSIGISGGTLTISGGTIDGSAITAAANAKNGGLIYLAGGIVEVTGTAVLKGGKASSTGNGIIVVNGATLKLSGGSFESDVYAQATSTLVLSGAAKASNINVTSGAKLTLGALTEGAEIFVTATAGNEITVANAEIATLKNYIKPIDAAAMTFEVTTDNTLKAVAVTAG